MSSASYANSIRLLTISKQYAFASSVLALYEFITTFGEEVEGIWCRKFTFATVLWIFNRYTVQISLFPIIIAFSFFLEFTDEQCIRFVKFPAIMQIVLNISSGITFSLRTVALYGRASWTLWVLIPSLLAEIAVESWAVAGGVPAILPKGQVGCFLSERPEQGERFAFFWIGQLYFPTLIFVMTIARALHMRRVSHLKDGLLEIIFRDGILYFFIIFLANFANVVSFAVLPGEAKPINAPFSNVITSLMACRLTLNLRVRLISDVEQSNKPDLSLHFATPDLDASTSGSPRLGRLAERRSQTLSIEPSTFGTRSSV